MKHFLISVGILIFCLFLADGSFGADLIKVDKALIKVYKSATDFDQKKMTLSVEQIMDIEGNSGVQFEGVHSTEITMYIARKGQDVLGQAFEDTVMGKWGPIHYLVGLDPQGAVLEVVILDYQEIRGKPIAKNRFLRQYKKKTVNDPLLLRKDIDGITGATISSRSLTDGIRKLLHVFKEIM